MAAVLNSSPLKTKPGGRSVMDRIKDAELNASMPDIVRLAKGKGVTIEENAFKGRYDPKRNNNEAPPAYQGKMRSFRPSSDSEDSSSSSDDDDSVSKAEIVDDGSTSDANVSPSSSSSAAKRVEFDVDNKLASLPDQVEESWSTNNLKPVSTESKRAAAEEASALTTSTPPKGKSTSALEGVITTKSGRKKIDPKIMFQGNQSMKSFKGKDSDSSSSSSSDDSISPADLVKQKKTASKTTTKKKQKEQQSNDDSSLSLSASDIAKKQSISSIASGSTSSVGGQTPTGHTSATRMKLIQTAGDMSLSRLQMDPMDGAKPKGKKKNKPHQPGWLVSPKKTKKVERAGALGISGNVALERLKKKKAEAAEKRKLLKPADCSSESKAYAQAVTKQLELDEASKSALTFDAVRDLTPVEKMMRIINHDPWTGRKQYDDRLMLHLFQEHPELCKDTYEFELSSEKLHPLSVVCAMGASDETVRACYKANPDAINDKDSWVGTTLHYACAYRAPKKVLKFLMSKNEEMVNEPNDAKRLPIHTAVMAHNKAAELAVLIKGNKLTLKRKDKDGMTPLHHACNRFDADEEVVKLLMEKYPRSCNIGNNKGSTPLHLAVERGCPENILRRLLQEGGKAFEMEDELGNLPLHTSITIKGDTKIIQFILWQNADAVDHRNKAGERPVEIAKRLRRKDYAIIEILEP